MRQYIPAIRWGLQLVDLVVVQACFIVLTLLKLDGHFPMAYESMMLISTLLMIVCYQWQRVYQHFRAGGLASEVGALLRAWGAVLVLLAVMGFATKTNTIFSRQVLLTWAVLGAAVQIAVHAATNQVLSLLRTRGVNRRRALLVGDTTRAWAFARRLRTNPGLGIEAVGMVTLDEPATKSPPGLDLPRLGTVERLAEVIRASESDLVYLTVPLRDSPAIEELMHQLVPLHVDVHWVPDVSALALLNHGAYDLDGQPVLTLSDSPLTGTNRAVKWMEDKILAAVILVLVSPLMLAIACAVKLTSPGPVLFKQKRAGRNGKPIVIYKFRSMVCHAEPPGQVTQAVRDDPRVTRVGAFLRRRSLDELPQFFNVLQGTMSIVGPRPHALEHDTYYAEQVRAYMLRHRVKPGITGWAQVNDVRGETSTPHKMGMRIKYDLFYINNWSLSFDLLIIALTFWRVFVSKAAI